MWSMKITDVTVKRYSAVARRPRRRGGHPDRRGSHGCRRDGHGVRVSGRSATSDVVATLLRRTLKAAVLGEDPLLTDDLWRRMHEALPRRGGEGLVRSCMAAVDFALWDIKGKLLKAPVSSLLGGRRARVATYANCAHHLPPDKLADKAAGYVKRGHTALKIRGSATFVSLHEATERVKHVREAVGPDVKLMVDVNGTWDVDTAIQQLKRWEPYDVYWLEEPVPPDDIPGYVRVRQRAGRTYIVGGEQHVGVPEFRQLIEQGAVDIVQPNAAITGRHHGLAPHSRPRHAGQRAGLAVESPDGPHPPGRRAPQRQVDRVLHGRQPAAGVPGPPVQGPGPARGGHGGRDLPGTARRARARPGAGRARWPPPPSSPSSSLPGSIACSPSSTSCSSAS